MRALWITPALATVLLTILDRGNPRLHYTVALIRQARRLGATNQSPPRSDIVAMVDVRRAFNSVNARITL